MAGTQLKGCEYLIVSMPFDSVFTPEDFSDEQRQFGETTELFVQHEIVAKFGEDDCQNFDLVIEGMRTCGELGLLMMDAPEVYGGLELDTSSSMLVVEKMAAAGAFALSYGVQTGLGSLPLIYYGTSQQKEKYLGKLISGEWIAAYCLTEPGSGSDALGARSSAVLSEDRSHYILNGTKQFITNGGLANMFTVFAKIDQEHFTAFLVERDYEGLIVGPEEEKLGLKGSSTTPVILENCKVPAENVLGEMGQGHKIAFNCLNIGRLKLGAGVTGAAKVALEAGIAYANGRVQFKRRISSFGAIKEKIADLTADVFVSESLVYRLAGLLDDNLSAIPRDIDGYYGLYQTGIKDFAAECSIAKVFCSEVLDRVVDETLQIHGGYGYVRGYPAQRYYRDARIHRIVEGTNEINRLLISGVILRKAMKAELPLQAESRKAFELLTHPATEELIEAVPFAAEKKLIANLKTLFLLLSGIAVQKFQNDISEEQEILIALSDIAIQIFALESAVLRAEKSLAGYTAEKQKLVESAIKVFAYSASESAGAEARKAVYYIGESVGESDLLDMLLSGARRFSQYDASGLLAAKRILAEAACEKEKYVFAQI